MKWIEVPNCADATEHGGYQGQTLEETEVLEVPGGALVKVARVYVGGGGRTSSLALAFVPGAKASDFAPVEAASPLPEGE